jgi:hypothetical protein
MDAVPGKRGTRRAVAAAAGALAAAAAMGAAALAAPAAPSAAPGRAAATPATVRLAISVSDGRGPVRTAHLRCVGARARADGYLRRLGAARACRRARALADFIVTPPQRGRLCTQVYGGPEHARLSGRIGGTPVARTFTRTHGCGISDYDRLRPLVPRPRPPAAGPAPHLPPY